MQELPIKIQTIVYKRVEDSVKILLVKRCPEDGGFWQTITGTLELDETIFESRARELKEETGIEKAEFSDELHRFSWKKKDYVVVELVYAAEVCVNDIALSPEHTEYCWLSPKDAIEKVAKQNTKDSLIKFSKILSEF